MKKIRTKAPGKLYVAGEYAVVEPGYSAIITTVDLFIHLDIQTSKKADGSIYSDGFTDTAVGWERVDGVIQLSKPMPALKYLISALRIVETYVQALGIELETYDITITSELNSQTGRKLGLGSSGAVTIALVRGLLQYYGVAVSDLLVYKLSVIAQLALAVNSSFGDLAAIAYTGWIRYTSFDRERVSRALEESSIPEVVKMDWPKLDIQRLEVAEDVQFLIGWTGSPASSDDLVGNVQRKKQQNPSDYQHFLEESKASVHALEQALPNNAIDQIKAAVARNRHALLAMGQQTNVLIETPQLTELCELAAKHGGAAKTSGAGGGDSGIAFMFDSKQINALIASWEAVGITNLPLSIYSKSE